MSSGLVGKRVWVTLGARTVEAVHDGGRVASHVRLAEGGWSTLKEHMPPGHARRREMTAERLRRDAGTVGEGAAALAAVLLGDGAGTEQVLRSCRRLLQLEGTWGRERLDAACVRVLSIGSPKVSSVESILRSGLDRRAAGVPPEPPRVEYGNIRGAAYFS